MSKTDVYEQALNKEKAKKAYLRAHSKSQLTGFILVFFFSTFGLLYSTVLGFFLTTLLLWAFNFVVIMVATDPVVALKIIFAVDLIVCALVSYDGVNTHNDKAATTLALNI